jgi:uncharacterized membrane protein
MDEIPTNRVIPKVPRNTGRLEAFSDGVFAIAITLLVLNIKVPLELPANTSLAAALIAQWPIYLAFITSFATIGIMWINHHRLFTLIARTDQLLYILNGLLLLGITFVPFPTELVAEYLLKPDRVTAAMVYNGTYVVIAIIFNGLWRHASHNHRLLDHHVPRQWVENITRQYRFGPIFYLIAFALALVSVPASLVLNLLMAVYFAFTGREHDGESAYTEP